MWHPVAPALSVHHTVVATDLRGYGDSGKPTSTDDHSPYSMRALAVDQVEVMRNLGFERFGVAGHDRGARCAYRMALDHPEVVTRLAVLDILPTGDVFRDADAEFALGFWVWSFLAAPAPIPETLVRQSPAMFVDHLLASWSDRPDAFPAEVRHEYVEKFSDPATIHAICAQYRAAATLDRRHDEADRRPQDLRATPAAYGRSVRRRSAASVAGAVAKCLGDCLDDADLCRLPAARFGPSFSAACGRFGRAVRRSVGVDPRGFLSPPQAQRGRSGRGPQPTRDFAARLRCRSGRSGRRTAEGIGLGVAIAVLDPLRTMRINDVAASPGTART
jgi:pimeloyl-ACP methyl ester carboxylesterase